MFTENVVNQENEIVIDVTLTLENTHQLCMINTKELYVPSYCRNDYLYM